MSNIIFQGKEYELIESKNNNKFKINLINSKFKKFNLLSDLKNTIFFTLPFFKINNIDFFSKKLIILSKKYLNINFIVITNDLPFTLRKWENLILQKNVIAVSDYFDNNFSKNFNLMLDKIFLLTKASFIIKNNNELILIDQVENLHHDVNFELLENFIQKNF